MRDKDYYIHITKDRDSDRERTFTYERKESFRQRCPGRASQIRYVFDRVQEICSPELMISTKEKGRYDISIIHGYTEEAYELLYNLETRTCEHCVECGSQGESRGGYQAALCDFCFNQRKRTL